MQTNLDGFTDFVQLLQFLGTATGSGIAASLLFDMLRDHFPAPGTMPTNPLVRAFYLALHAPRYARVTSMLIAVAVASITGAVVAAALGQDFNAIAAAALAPAVAQAKHGLTYLDNKAPDR